MVYWTLDYFRILYSEYLKVNISARDFCQKQGISENRFYYWTKKLKCNAVANIEQPKSFIPISSEAVSCLATAIQSKQEKVIRAKPSEIKIVYPNGVVLQLESDGDLEILRQLINFNSYPHV